MHLYTISYYLFFLTLSSSVILCLISFNFGYHESKHIDSHSVSTVIHYTLYHPFFLFSIILFVTSISFLVVRFEPITIPPLLLSMCIGTISLHRSHNIPVDRMRIIKNLHQSQKLTDLLKTFDMAIELLLVWKTWDAIQY